MELLQPPRDGDRPDPVAEMALELADDGREDVGDELDVAIEVEAVDRLDQPERGDLLEILELLAATGVAARERRDERHEVRDQPVAGGDVALLAVGAQQRAAVDLGAGERSSCRHRQSLAQDDRRRVARRQLTVSTRRSSEVPSSTPAPSRPSGCRASGRRRARSRLEAAAVIDQRDVTDPSPAGSRAQHELDRELEVVDRLEAELEARREPAGRRAARRSRSPSTGSVIDTASPVMIWTVAVRTKGRDAGGKRHETLLPVQGEIQTAVCRSRGECIAHSRRIEV